MKKINFIRLTIVILIVAITIIGCETVKFRSDPTGADVYLNDDILCKTPCDINVDTMQGEYNFVAKKEGYKNSERFIQASALAPNELPSTMHFKFEPLDNKKKENQLLSSTPLSNKIPKAVNVSYLNSSSKRWAVIIGISNYKDTKIPSLRYASADAQSFYDWTVSPNGGKYSPARVKLLLDKNANFKNIRNALFVWLKQALEEDIVTIYFAGHGSPDSPDSSNNLFLLPSDSQYDNIATTGFPMWDIETALKRFINAKKVIVIADACHSGGVGESFDIARRANRGIKVNPISSGIQNLSQVGDGVCVVSASSDKQFSQESQIWGGGHGVFTYFLLKGLKGDADYNKDTSVTLGELTSYLSEQVRRETKNAQSPTVAGRYDPALTIGK